MAKQLTIAATSVLLVGSVAGINVPQHPIRHELVESIKSKTKSWKPQEVENNHFKDIPLDRLQKKFGLMGTDQFSAEMKAVTESALNMTSQAMTWMGAFFGVKGNDDENITQKFKLKAGNGEPIQMLGENGHGIQIPSEFSWLTKKAECVGPIEDQGECGSCWAFASSGLLADRFCIHSDGAINTRLSPQEMTNCNYENFACLGGYLMPSIDYLQTEGAVPTDCVKYKGETGMCSYRCDNGTVDNYKKHFCKVGSLHIATRRHEIMKELVINGPMMMGLIIYEDFMNYESGIYKHVDGDEIGGHAMKLIGYGHDEVEGHYWILQNQWTTAWGEQGFAKIKAGQIGIDSIALSCMPDLL